MEGPVLTRGLLITYRLHLRTEELRPRHDRKISAGPADPLLWLEERRLTKELAAEWKAHLLSAGYMPVTINSMLAALNGLCRFLGLDWRIRYLEDPAPHVPGPVPRAEPAPSMTGLWRQPGAAEKERLALLMEAICATGVRVSEVKYLSVEAAQRGRAEISLKGKIRVILLAGKLCRKL